MLRIPTVKSKSRLILRAGESRLFLDQAYLSNWFVKSTFPPHVYVYVARYSCGSEILSCTSI